MPRTIVLFASPFFVALSSGGPFVVYLVYNPANMSPTFYVEAMQHAIRVVNPVAVVLNLGLLCTLASAEGPPQPQASHAGPGDAPSR